MRYGNCFVVNAGPWSGEYEFEKWNIISVPENPGVYMLCIARESGYRWVKRGGNWYLEEMRQASGLEVIIRQKLWKVVRLTYIGQTNNLRERLLQHLNNPNNKCVKKLLELDIPLTFRFLSRGNPEASELKAYNKFCEETGLCPPCDCNSPQCKSLVSNGKCLGGKTIINIDEVC